MSEASPLDPEHARVIADAPDGGGGGGGGVTDPEHARLLRKLRRQLDKSEGARLALEAQQLAAESQLQRVVVRAEQGAQELSGSAELRGTLEYAAMVHTRDGAAAGLRTLSRELDPLSARAAAAASLAAAAAAPPAPPLVDEDATAAAARAARLRALLHPRGAPAFHPAPWDSSKPDPLWIGRVPASTGAPDFSLIPQTHQLSPNTVGQPGGTVAWVPTGRSSEATQPAPKNALCATGTWRGHAELDAAAEGARRGFVSTARGGLGVTASAALGVTTGSAARFPHDPIPSHVVPAERFTATSAPVPQALLKSLTREQLRMPRHPAYLLDAHLHHAEHWRRPERVPGRTFSYPPKLRPPTLNELKKAALAMVPDRSLPSADPVHHGAPAFYSEVRGAPLFSKVPADYQWETARRAEDAAAREDRFWAAAALAEQPYRPPGEEDAAAATIIEAQRAASASAASRAGFRGGDRSGPLAAAATAAAAAAAAGLGGGVGSLGASRVAGGSGAPSPLRRGAPDGGPTWRTFSASGALPSRAALARGASVTGGAGAGAPALSLLRGPQGKLLPLRSALVFGTAEAALEYEAAKAALLSSAAMGARALHEAHEREEAQLRATEARLMAMGVNTGEPRARGAPLRPFPHASAYPPHNTTPARRPRRHRPAGAHARGLAANPESP
jgi:hypothetical protein